MGDALVNRVAESSLVTIDLEKLGGKLEWVFFDLKSFLYMELMLKEKDFRQALKEHDWTQYQGKGVAVSCSTDAIIPMWAYMLVGSYLQPIAAAVFFGDIAAAVNAWRLQQVYALDAYLYEGKRVVIKGCGDEPVSEAVYLAITVKLRPHAKSIMYGEPCSTVPIYKQKSV